MKENGLVEYNKSDLLKVVKKHNCGGVGTEKTPYVIDNNATLPDNLFVKNSKLFFRIENQNFSSLALRWCKNLTFVSCNFQYLRLHQSRDIHLLDSEVKFLELIGATSNVLEKTKIQNGYNANSSGNLFRSCSIPENVFEERILSSSIDFSGFVKIINYVLVLLGVSVLSTLLMSVIGDFDYLSVIIFGIVFLVFLILQIFIKKAIAKSRLKELNKIEE